MCLKRVEKYVMQRRGGVYGIKNGQFLVFDGLKKYIIPRRCFEQKNAWLSTNKLFKNGGILAAGFDKNWQLLDFFQRGNL
jgi:hypothetical protein